MYKRFSLATVTALLTVVISSTQAEQLKKRSVIIATPKPYSNLIRDIQKLGGVVTEQFKYVDAIAADVPVNALPALRQQVAPDAVSENTVIAAPKPVRVSYKRALKTQVGVYASVPVGAGLRIFNSEQGPPNGLPGESAYSVNMNKLSARQLHATGITGKGITVAVIDSGVRPGYFSLDSDGSVIGGENFVPDGPSNFFSDTTNDPHGTFVASLISGNARFFVPASSTAFISSMDVNFPGALENSGTGRYLSVVGTAPEASIYAIRVFGTNALAGAPRSRVMAAIERVIDLREMYDHGTAGGVNIRVCSMSFGLSTIYAGHTPLEQLIDQLLAKDIVPVVAAGDAGSSSLTIASPATSFSSLTIGATSPASNERLWRDVSGDFDASARPSSATQTAFFSSRGPTADGRIFPDVVAAGFGVVSQGCGGDNGFGVCIYNPNSIDIASGTSFSAPIVAGVAALLRQEFPRASAGQIWNAIVNGADRSLLGDGSTVLDQGQGVPNAMNSVALLQSGKASDKLPEARRPDSSVRNNIEHNTDLNVSHGTVKQSFTKLKPGERGEILYEVQHDTSEITIDLTKIKPTLPPAQQNPLFGDDIFLNIQTAKTSSGAFGDYFAINPPFVVADTSFVIPNPEPGIVRITLMGDETNAGTISADVMVTSLRNPPPSQSAGDDIQGGDNVFYIVDIPSGVSVAKFQLRWNADWSAYPTNDLDMYLFDPLGAVNSAGATLNSPERATINSPMPGKWTILIQGFAVPIKKDKFQLSVILDGRSIKLK